MIDNNYEGELEVVVIEDEEGNPHYYEEDDVITFDGKEFAILVSIPDEADSDEEGEVIIARLEGEGDEVNYLPPTEEEFDGVIAILDAEEGGCGDSCSCGCK